ncbi:MAG: glycosyltransferase family 2 protein [Candidatus Omnitrophota bacterium]|jgi:GT2 family glycosyltransferase
MEVASNEIVSVIVVAGGIKHYLESCLDSLRRQSYNNLEIIVIDNSLNPNFRQDIIRSYPEIRLYSENNNLFYGGALNKGINLSKGDYILCLNDDVTLDTRFIEKALSGFYQHASVGMVSGKILRSDGSTIDSAGLFLSPWRTARERGYGIKDRAQFDRPGYIFGVNGAVAFYQRKTLEDIKIGPDYFDSDFRMFYEDLDVAWRSQNFGWRTYYVPEAVAYHIRGGTARQGSGINQPYARRYINDELHYDLIKNRYLSIVKNESVFGFLMHLPFILLYDFIILSYILFFNPRFLKNLLQNLKYLKSALDKRGKIKARIREKMQIG